MFKDNKRKSSPKTVVVKPVKEPVVVLDPRAAYNCAPCKGEGLLDNGNICQPCRGTGRV